MDELQEVQTVSEVYDAPVVAQQQTPETKKDNTKLKLGVALGGGIVAGVLGTVGAIKLSRKWKEHKQKKAAEQQNNQ